MSIQILVNDVDYSSYVDQVKVNSNITYYTRSYSVRFLDPNHSLYNQFGFGDDVKIYLEGNYILRGRLEDKTTEEYGVIIKGRDYTARFLDRNVYAEYTNREISDIITNTTDGLIPKYTPEITTNNVQTTNKYITRKWVQVPLLVVLHELASIVNYDFYVDTDLDLHFFPRKSRDSGKTLDNSNLLKYDIPDVGKKVVNRITLFGKEGICVQVEDPGSIAKYGVKEKEPIIDPSITDPNTAYEKAAAILRKLANPIRQGTYITLTTGFTDLKPGDLITVNIPEKNVNSQFLVLEVTFTCPPYHAEIKTAEYTVEYADLLADLTKKVVDINMRDADLEATIQRYYRFEEQKKLRVICRIYRTFVEDGWIWGNPIFSKWGTRKWGYQAGQEELIWSNE